MLVAWSPMRSRFLATNSRWAQAAADLDPGDLRQHPAEHDDVGQALGNQGQGLLAVGGDGDLVAFLVEIVLQQGREGVFVLDHQDMGRQIATPRAAR